MEMETKRFLPIGTIVLLKNASKPLMITSYCVIPMGNIYNQDGLVDKSQIIYYEYGGCLYPNGIQRTNRTFVFNHDQIDKILHFGYESANFKVFSASMNESISVIDAQKDQILRERDLTKVHFDMPKIEL